jgi:hypothetical protein
MRRTLGLLIVCHWMYLLDCRIFSKLKHCPKGQEDWSIFFSLVNRYVSHNSLIFFSLKSLFLLLAPYCVRLFSSITPFHLSRNRISLAHLHRSTFNKVLLKGPLDSAHDALTKIYSWIVIEHSPGHYSMLVKCCV